MSTPGNQRSTSGISGIRRTDPSAGSQRSTSSPRRSTSGPQRSTSTSSDTEPARTGSTRAFIGEERRRPPFPSRSNDDFLSEGSSPIGRMVRTDSGSEDQLLTNPIGNTIQADSGLSDRSQSGRPRYQGFSAMSPQVSNGSGMGREVSRASSGMSRRVSSGSGMGREVSEVTAPMSRQTSTNGSGLRPERQLVEYGGVTMSEVEREFVMRVVAEPITMHQLNNRELAVIEQVINSLRTNLEDSRRRNGFPRYAEAMPMAEADLDSYDYEKRPLEDLSVAPARPAAAAASTGATSFAATSMGAMEASGESSVRPPTRRVYRSSNPGRLRPTVAFLGETNDQEGVLGAFVCSLRAKLEEYGTTVGDFLLNLNLPEHTRNPEIREIVDQIRFFANDESQRVADLYEFLLERFGTNRCLEADNRSMRSLLIENDVCRELGILASAEGFEDATYQAFCDSLEGVLNWLRG